MNVLEARRTEVESKRGEVAKSSELGSKCQALLRKVRKQEKGVRELTDKIDGESKTIEAKKVKVCPVSYD